MTYLYDGYSSTIDLALGGNLLVRDIEPTPPPITGGGPINVTTMENSAVRTQRPKNLYSVGQITRTVEYDPEAYRDIMALIQVNQKITVNFADGATMEVFGWIEEFTPGSYVEGERPTAEIVIEVSNLNASLVETAPSYVGTGTTTAAPTTTVA